MLEAKSWIGIDSYPRKSAPGVRAFAGTKRTHMAYPLFVSRISYQVFFQNFILCVFSYLNEIFIALYLSRICG